MVFSSKTIEKTWAASSGEDDSLVSEGSKLWLSLEDPSDSEDSLELEDSLDSEVSCDSWVVEEEAVDCSEEELPLDALDPPPQEASMATAQVNKLKRINGLISFSSSKS